MDVVVWLRGLGLEEYEAAFRDNKINEQVLPSLTQEDLKEIGVGPVGHRRILLDAIAAHANTAAPLVGTDTSVTYKLVTVRSLALVSAPAPPTDDTLTRTPARPRGCTTAC
jgi:hypothetical protein